MPLHVLKGDAAAVTYNDQKVIFWDLCTCARVLCMTFTLMLAAVLVCAVFDPSFDEFSNAKKCKNVLLLCPKVCSFLFFIERCRKVQN